MDPLEIPDVDRSTFSEVSEQPLVVVELDHGQLHFPAREKELGEEQVAAQRLFIATSPKLGKRRRAALCGGNSWVCHFTKA